MLGPVGHFLEVMCMASFSLPLRDGIVCHSVMGLCNMYCMIGTNTGCFVLFFSHGLYSYDLNSWKLYFLLFIQI